MKLSVVLIALFYLACNNSENLKKGSGYEVLCNKFLQNLYQKNYNSVIDCMDKSFVDAVDKTKLTEGLEKLSESIREEFQESIQLSVITSEKTIHEKIPAIFLIAKLQTSQKFGYYFFYVNEQTNKILLVSEFSRIKERRM